jgi:hypothetical protein
VQTEKINFQHLQVQIEKIILPASAGTDRQNNILPESSGTDRQSNILPAFSGIDRQNNFQHL